MADASFDGKRMKITGEVDIHIDENNRFIIEPKNGLVLVTTMDVHYLTTRLFHPLTGWYVQFQTPIEEPDESDDSDDSDLTSIF